MGYNPNLLLFLLEKETEYGKEEDILWCKIKPSSLVYTDVGSGGVHPATQFADFERSSTTRNGEAKDVCSAGMRPVFTGTTQSQQVLTWAIYITHLVSASLWLPSYEQPHVCTIREQVGVFQARYHQSV